jgi:tetratricopeptide (TPR) repeat protein
MAYSQAGLRLTEQLEGCHLAAYQDSAGVWTIACGHTQGVYAGMTCAQAHEGEWRKALQRHLECHKIRLSGSARSPAKRRGPGRFPKRQPMTKRKTVGIGKLTLRSSLPGLLILFALGSAGFGLSQVAVQPAGPAQSLERAQALMAQGKNQEAAEVLEGALAKDPQGRGLEAALGQAYYSERQYEPAATHLERAIRQNPQDGESVQLLGISYYLLGHMQQAIPLLEKVQSWLPHPDVTGSYILGVSYLQLGDLDKSRAAFAKMFSVPPDSAGAYVALAKMMLQHQFEEKAVGQLQKAVALDPHQPEAHFMLGEIYLFKSDVPAALVEFNKELALNPIAWDAYWRMGDAYTRVEKWNEAEKALKQAIWLNPDFSAPYILLGKVEMKKGNTELAAGFLERAVKMDPNNYSAHYLLGSAYKELGRQQDADREFELTRTLQAQKDR